MRERSSRLPLWIGDDAALKAWTIAKLDKLDAVRIREMAESAAALATKLERELGVRSKAENRKRWLTIGRRASAKAWEQREQRAVEEGDIETLRKLHPKLAAFINPVKPKRRGPFDEHDWQGLSPEDCLTEALHELPLIHAVWKESFGRTNRPSGTLTAEQVAAEHWGLAERDVRRQRVHAATRKRLARQR